MRDDWCLINGFWFPFEAKYNKTTLKHVTFMPRFLEHVKGRDVVVQAGGNCGVYPLSLARHFKKVYTFEPFPENFACLTENIKGTDNIIATNAALGGAKRQVKMNKHEANSGGHSIREEPGEIQMVTIDSLELEACDLIWLDIEGYEVNALEGAVKTIKKLSPVVIYEKARMYAAYSDISPGEWLEDMGYQYIFNRRHDFLMARK